MFILACHSSLLKRFDQDRGFCRHRLNSGFLMILNVAEGEELESPGPFGFRFRGEHATSYALTLQLWRRRPGSNRKWRFCRPLPYRLATPSLNFILENVCLYHTIAWYKHTRMCLIEYYQNVKEPYKTKNPAELLLGGVLVYQNLYKTISNPAFYTV